MLDITFDGGLRRLRLPLQLTGRQTMLCRRRWMLMLATIFETRVERSTFAVLHANAVFVTSTSIH